MKTIAIAALALFLFAGLSGCAGKEKTQDIPEGTPTVTDATGKAIVDEAPSNETVTTASGDVVAANKAIVLGRVHDDFNFSLAGAFVSVVGTGHFAQTDQTGRYALRNVTVGTFDVRFEMDQFKVREERLTLKAGTEHQLDIELQPLVERSGGFNPHVHDFWGQDATRIIMDDDITVNDVDEVGGARGTTPGPVAAASCGVGSCTVPFVLPDQEDGAPSTIWPGTKEIQVTLTWSGQVPVSSIRMSYSDPAGDDGETSAAPSGTMLAIPIAPHLQDHGHAKWTAWTFAAVITNAPTAPSYVSGTLHVRIELVKGDVVLDPPHPDFWKGRTELAIGDWAFPYFPNTGVPPTPADSTSGFHVFPLRHCPAPKEGEPAEECISIVPPGATRVQIRFAWLPSANGPAPFDYSLRYTSAEQNPHTLTAADFRVPTLIEEDLDADWRLYEVEIESEQADGFYMLASDWVFKWVQDTGLPYNVLQNQYKFNIEVTALRSA